MAKDREDVTIHTMNPVNQRGPVFYASLPCGPSDTGTLKHRLVSTLWDHLAAMDSPLWKRCQSSNRAAFPIRVVCGLLGRPHLLLGEYRGPAISFSEGGGKVWAALCGDESDVGIDVAGADEFQGEYPFHRVFNPIELQHALKSAGGELEKASALLWSIKEAVVKALGCAFHLVDPRQINVYPPQGVDIDGYTFPVGLSGKALKRFPIASGTSLRVRSLPHGKLWLSVALLTVPQTSKSGEHKGSPLRKSISKYGSNYSAPYHNSPCPPLILRGGTQQQPRWSFYRRCNEASLPLSQGQEGL